MQRQLVMLGKRRRRWPNIAWTSHARLYSRPINQMKVYAYICHTILLCFLSPLTLEMFIDI